MAHLGRGMTHLGRGKHSVCLSHFHRSTPRRSGSPSPNVADTQHWAASSELTVRRNRRAHLLMVHTMVCPIMRAIMSARRRKVSTPNAHVESFKLVQYFVLERTTFDSVRSVAPILSRRRCDEMHILHPVYTCTLTFSLLQLTTITHIKCHSTDLQHHPSAFQMYLADVLAVLTTVCTRNLDHSFY